AEVRLVTKDTESIKAQISGNLWERQNRWNAKRDIYVRLLENLELVKLALAQADYAQRVLGDPDAINRVFDNVSTEARDFRKTMAIARLFADPAVDAAWQNLSVLNDSIGRPGQDALKRIQDHLKAYEDLTDRLIQIAEKDLKLESVD